jgi:hypothetical protein
VDSRANLAGGTKLAVTDAAATTTTCWFWGSSLRDALSLRSGCQAMSGGVITLFT